MWSTISFLTSPADISRQFSKHSFFNVWKKLFCQIHRLPNVYRDCRCTSFDQSNKICFFYFVSAPPYKAVIPAVADFQYPAAYPDRIQVTIAIDELLLPGKSEKLMMYLPKFTIKRQLHSPFEWKATQVFQSLININYSDL
jgi:hypothetical protein